MRRRTLARARVGTWIVPLACLISLALASPAGAVSFTRNDYPVSSFNTFTPEAESVAVADLNGDGKPDIATLDGTAQVNKVSVFINKGDGTFASAVQHDTGCSDMSTSLIAGEFDHTPDANPDLLLVCAPDAVEMPGNGAGGFGPSITYKHLNMAGPVVVGPFDRNAHTDLGYASLGGRAFCFIPVALLSATDSYTPPTCDNSGHLLDSEPLVLSQMSETGDHTPRALGLSHQTGPQTLEVLADTNATCCAESDRQVGGPAEEVATGDLNGDGESDVIMGNGVGGQPGSISVYIWDHATGIPPSATLHNYGSIAVFRIAVADFDRDGKLDVAGAGYDPTTNAGEVAIHAGDGAGGLDVGPPTFPLPNFKRSSLGGKNLIAADLNGDGAPDLVGTYDNSGGSAGMSVLLNTTPAPKGGGTQNPFAGLALTAVTEKVGKNGKLKLPLSCPSTAVGDCAGDVTLKTKGKFSPKAVVAAAKHGKKKKKRVVKVGAGPFSIAPGKSTQVTIKVSKAALKLLKKHASLACTETVVAHDSRGVAKTTTAKLTLKGAKKKKKHGG